MTSDIEKISSVSVAQALAADYFSIYYVNTQTDHFVEYSASSEYHELGIEKSGADFFELSRRNIQRIIYPDDQDMFLSTFTKEKLLTALNNQPTYTLTYRLMLNGKPTYVHMKATRIRDRDDAHIVIGVSNIDAQMKAKEEYERAHQAVVTYSRIAQALAEDYFSIYYVDAETDSFVEYSVTSDYEKLGVEKAGGDFFNLSRRNIQRIIFPEDKERVLKHFTKENVLSELEKHGSFTLKYRLLFDGIPIWVSLKATLLNDSDGRHVVIGVNNIDAQIRREQEYALTLTEAHERANRDSLTGVKSKHAYVEAEDELDRALKEGRAEPFCLLFCDVNGLKTVNDSKGHQAGDRLIREACSLICEIFKHSPVYRIGGDEFVVIARGHDQEHAEELLSALLQRSEMNRSVGGAVVAAGLARPKPGDRMADVFGRADAQMYERKRLFKDSSGGGSDAGI